jgi:hypothetical protein
MGAGDLLAAAGAGASGPVSVTPTSGARPCTYVLPLRSRERVGDELVSYLAGLAGRTQVVVVDGSSAAVFDDLHRRVAAFAEHLPPDADLVGANGKVAGVLTGLRRAAHDLVVLGDDDVRHDAGSLGTVLALLEDAECVLPQNHFEPLPWHAVWDTARTLCNRAVGDDMPGTIGLRRSFLLERAGGYDGDVLFENLELVRTIRAAGGRVRSAPGCHVRRLPPTTAHFLGQRVRQAYDELARPWRLAGFLALLPLTALGARRRPRLTAACWAGGPMILAELGRRRAGGRAVFPSTASVIAPLWVLERAVCAWLAVGARLRGGVRYGDGRIRRAATPRRTLRRRICERMTG